MEAVGVGAAGCSRAVGSLCGWSEAYTRLSLVGLKQEAGTEIGKTVSY